MPLGYGSQLDVTPPPTTGGGPPMPKAGGLKSLTGAGTGSPASGMGGPGGMPSASTTAAAGGPPSPGNAPYGTGSGGPTSAGSQVGSGAASLPQPMIQGIMEAGVQMGLMLDSFAQATPDLSGQVDAVRAALQEYLGQLMVAGAGPTGPTATGTPFPGGGFDRGPLR